MEMPFGMSTHFVEFGRLGCLHRVYGGLMDFWVEKAHGMSTQYFERLRTSVHMAVILLHAFDSVI